MVRYHLKFKFSAHESNKNISENDGDYNSIGILESILIFDLKFFYKS